MGWPLVILLLFALIGTVPASSFTPPQNLVNQKDATDTEIACGLPDHGPVTGKAWFKTSDSGTQIANNDGIVSGKETDYELDLEGNKWNLKIKKALVIDDADKYICKTTANTGTARLVLVDTPSCTLANKDADKVTFRCTTAYGGDWPPRATMKDDNDNPIGDAVAGASGTLTREEDITVTEANNGHGCKCEMGFVIADNPDRETAQVAKNIPDTADAKYKCSITAVKPAGVTITSRGGQSELVKDDTLTCTASTPGVPTTTYRWSDPTGGDLGSAATYRVTESMVGKTVTCSIRNNIGSSSVTFPASGSTEGSTSTESPENTSKESSGRRISGVMGELGLTVLVALLCY